jgi:glycosyltransferase involved in cell wall biosynthesis
MLSIIIPYHNEGRPFIETTIAQIWKTIDVSPYEIIVVDNGSTIPLELGDVKMIRHDINKGVGAAFDSGVGRAIYENLILMGCDIRFDNNGWASKMLAEIEANPKSLICSKCIGLNLYSRCCNEIIQVSGICSKCNKPAIDNMDISYRRYKLNLNGATILMFHDKKSNPRVTETFRGIIEAKWLPGRKETVGYEIPCILGAFYGVKKAWYNYVDGWEGHRVWGTLEPMISMKSWLFGGSCRMAPMVETGHIFKKHGTHGTPQDILFYNKMMVATLLLDDYKRVIAFLGDNSILQRSRKMYEDNLPWILQKKKEYQTKIVLKPEDFFRKWDIDYRDKGSITGKITPDFIRDECNLIYSKEKSSYNLHYNHSPYLKIWNRVAEYIKPGERIVDIGCGVGQVMDLLLDKGVGSYTGLDISPIAISKACERLSRRDDQHKVTLILINVLNGFILPDADKYILIEILEHLSADKNLLRKIPAGKEVLITVPDYLGGSHVRKFKSEAEVIERYKDVIENKAISTVAYGSGRIFVMKGKKL